MMSCDDVERQALTRESSRGGESVSSVRANQDKDPMPPRGKPISCHSSRIQEWLLNSNTTRQYLMRAKLKILALPLKWDH